MFSAIFIDKIQETPTDWSFRFKRPEGFEYKAGQYSVIRVELAYPDARSNARTCSMSSSPSEELIQFTFTMRDTGFKKTLMALNVGDKVELTPARGKLILDAVTQPRCVMIAGGIGVAPFRGMIKYAYDNQLPLDLVLVYSDKTIAELAYYQEFKSIENNYKNFQAIYTLTRHETDHGEWAARQGRIDTMLIKESLGDLSNTTFMVCGPVEMAQSAISQLESLGVAREYIISELFTGY